MGAAFTLRMRISPLSEPPAIPNRTILRRELEASIELLIAQLDEMDGDTDLEPDADGEPWLGWSKTYAYGSMDDREADSPKNDGGDEP